MDLANEYQHFTICTGKSPWGAWDQCCLGLTPWSGPMYSYLNSGWLETSYKPHCVIWFITCSKNNVWFCMISAWNQVKLNGFCFVLLRTPGHIWIRNVELGTGDSGSHTEQSRTERNKQMNQIGSSSLAKENCNFTGNLASTIYFNLLQ